MCRLLAIAGTLKPEIEIEILQKFQHLAETGCVPAGITKGHKDGWGIVALAKGIIKLYERHAEDASESVAYNHVVQALQVTPHDIVVAHLRKASVGSATTENTHPFRCGNFIFAHNGTIVDHQKIPLSEVTQVMLHGSTDSERFFYYLIEKYCASPNRSMEEIIREAVVMVRKNLEYRSLSFIMSNGKYIWTLREVNEDNLLVKEKRLLEYVTLYHTCIDNATVFCSEKITNSAWALVDNHVLTTVELGTGNTTQIKI